MLEDLLKRKREAILARWWDLVLETYPAETARFLTSEKDRIANPVGYAVSHGIRSLYDELLAGGTRERFETILDEIVRIRSVQDLEPAQAVGFIFFLKRAVREAVAREAAGDALDRKSLEDFEDRVDGLALLAFNGYMRCREDLFDLRARTLKHGPFKPNARWREVLEQTQTHETDAEGGIGQ